MSPTRTVVALVICLPLAWLSFKFGTSDIALDAGRYQAALARDPRSTSAATGAAATLLANGDPAGARAAAEIAVARTPISQPAVRALALADQALDKNDAAAALMGRAAALGWRDAPTQSWLVDSALKAGAWQAAAERIDALARRGDEDARRLFPLVRRLSVDPAAGPAMIGRLAKNPAWRTQFFYTVAQLPASEFALQDVMIERLAASKAPMTRDEARAYISRLLVAGDYRHARAVWRSVPEVARYAGRQEVYDGGFAHVITGPAHILFEWVLPDAAGSSASVQPAKAGNPQLLVESSGSEPASLAVQFLILAPGPHMLAVDRANDDPAANALFHWRLYCMPRFTFAPSAPAGETRHGDMIRERTRFVVPAEGCAYQQLTLRAEPGTLPGDSHASFDNIAIDE